jgi:predicted membrane chloride channel (bestrophin family)
VLVLCGIKIAVHALGLERISVNQLFSAMVASTVFLLGFLLSGVLTDFKESEKIPGELTTSIQTLILEIRAIQAYHPEVRVAPAVQAVEGLGLALIDWLKEQITTDEILILHQQVHGQVVLAAGQFKGDSSTLKGRLMQDLANILQKVNRVQTIRDTTFVPIVYWMADIASVLLFAGLVMARAENLAESVFFLAVISFIVILLLRLIDDIDNPFGLSDPDSAEDVSIALLEKAVERFGLPKSSQRF